MARSSLQQVLYVPVSNPRPCIKASENLPLGRHLRGFQAFYLLPRLRVYLEELREKLASPFVFRLEMLGLRGLGEGRPFLRGRTESWRPSVEHPRQATLRGSGPALGGKSSAQILALNLRASQPESWLSMALSLRWCGGPSGDLADRLLGLGE